MDNKKHDSNAEKKEKQEKRLEQKTEEKSTVLEGRQESTISEKEKQLIEQLMRLKAEFDNFRKRCMKEKEDAIRFANERFITEFIGILDDFDRALQNVKEDNSNKQIVTGVRMVQSNLYRFLRSRGLEQIEAVGKSFDPHLHEAVEEIESDEYKNNEIVDEIRKGYKLHNIVIRPSAVRVAKDVGEKTQTEVEQENNQIEESI